MNRTRLMPTVVIALATAATAHGAVVCKRKSGQMFIREACRKKETAVNLADFGAVGPQGATGATGPAGPFVDTLPSGQTLRGSYSTYGTAVSGAAQNTAMTAVTFAFPLASAPTGHFIAKGVTPPTECPGNAASPAAAAGHLCVYEGGQVAQGTTNILDPAVQGAFGTRPWGFLIQAPPSSGGFTAGFGTWGSWAVTAP